MLLNPEVHSVSNKHNASSAMFSNDQDSMSIEEVQRRLEEQFKDTLCIAQAMQVIKSKTRINKKVKFRGI